MKKNVLAVSIAAMIGGLGFAGVASAAAVISNATATAVPGASAAANLEVAPSGIGHILTVPYFSTQNGNVSLLNIVNTDTTNGKAVKLRYRGAANSDDIYDITVFLSPGDVWTANVSQKNGISTLTTDDNSCTLPYTVNGDFNTNRVKGNDKAQTLEGYIEILNMADVPPTLAGANGALTGTANPLYTAIKHVNGTAPCTTAVLDLQGTDVNGTAGDANAWYARGYNFPTNGLMANWSIVNLSKSGSFSGEATAVIASSSAGVAGAANIVFSPQTSESVNTTAAPAAADNYTADPLLRGGAAAIIQAANYDFPDLSTPYVNGLTPVQQANLLSGALAVKSVANEYLTNPAVSFGTDWVFSMPTRRYGVALNYATGTAVFNTATPSLFFDASNSYVNATKDLICVKPGTTSLSYFNRSEQSTKNGFVISPGQVATLEFCGETSVLAFNNTGDSVLGSVIARKNIKTLKQGSSTDVYPDGWMSVATPGLGAGLPVAGHAYVKALSSSSNLGGTWRHRYSK